ncbi:hypothetical protein ACFPVT_07905 [Corynebacterium choanae]|uniref:Uncharacterized protein n=1 Tax=Corynebacterium choanae TaxID=1862358 RepID=A0A3G6J7K4_9CORY|nr:hypothetical protein [Corynebacterium choanae]AZA14037.1 hypothetical protein CCHOA_08230 [Corynebacterium choanae]
MKPLAGIVLYINIKSGQILASQAPDAEASIRTVFAANLAAGTTFAADKHASGGSPRSSMKQSITRQPKKLHRTVT